MPIQSINDNIAINKETTLDASGREIITKELPTFDSSGRNYEEKQETPEVVKEEVKIEEKQEVPKNADFEARKLYLEAQKAERRAKEKEKKASANLEKAEAFEKAKALADSGEDPTALIKAAGLDPVKFYRDLTSYATSDKAKNQEDPIQKELREHKERLDKYAKTLEEQAKTIKEKEELAAHNQVIASTVIPLLQNNPEKYEILITEYGADAAAQVYKTVWEIYQETGKARKFEEVADEMENYWTEKIESGINAAFKLKKFQNKFAQANSETSRETKVDQTETPNRSSKTLSNKQTTPSSSPKQYDRYLSANERAAEIIKKFGG